MKIRNGFVSNSSSSSFIIALNGSVPCPHCGRVDQSIIDVICRLSGSGSSDSEIHWEDPTEYIVDLQKDIDVAVEELKKYNGLSNNHVITKTYTNSEYKYIVKDLRRWAKGTIDNNTKLINDINRHLDLNKTVVKVEIDDHDELLNDMFNEQCNNDTLTLIEGE